MNTFDITSLTEDTLNELVEELAEVEQESFEYAYEVKCIFSGKKGYGYEEIDEPAEYEVFGYDKYLNAIYEHFSKKYGMSKTDVWDLEDWYDVTFIRNEDDFNRDAISKYCEYYD